MRVLSRGFPLSKLEAFDDISRKEKTYEAVNKKHRGFTNVERKFTRRDDDEQSLRTVKKLRYDLPKSDSPLQERSFPYTGKAGLGRLVKEMDVIKEDEDLEFSTGSSDDTYTKSTRSLSTTMTQQQPMTFIVRLKRNFSQHAGSPIKLFSGAILGRSVVSRMSGKRRKERNNTDMKKVDIGIGYRKGRNSGRYDDGISRNHIEIVDMSDDEILIKIGDNVKNPITVKSGRYENNYGRGEATTLADGDMIIFDTYMKRPKHVFEVILTGSTTRSNGFEYRIE